MSKRLVLIFLVASLSLVGCGKKAGTATQNTTPVEPEASSTNASPADDAKASKMAPAAPSPDGGAAGGSVGADPDDGGE